ncbi:hypothetical protein [Haloparvum sp. AD34]
MTEPYLTTVLEEAEHVAEQHDQVARTTDNQAHEYLRYAVLRVLEGESEHLPADWTPIDGVTVGYGSDDAMYDSWSDAVEWWDHIPPQEGCTRFRIFYPAEYETVPRTIVDAMGALGAWRVWSGDAAACGSYDHRDRREVHYLWREGHPIEARLVDRLQSPDAATPDGGQTGDMRDRMVVAESSSQSDDLDPRTRRAVTEEMSISLLEKGGRYEVRSGSGNRYEVDVVSESCSCPDWQQRAPDGGCKHLRRVDLEIKRGSVPRPDGRLPKTSI